MMEGEQVNPFEIVRNVHWIGVRHPDLKLFDDLLPTRRGTTYNSYLVRGEQVAVVDTVKEMFAEEYLRNMATLVDPKRIAVIVVNHTEPDHSGTLSRLIELAPQARLFASRAAKLYLKNLLNRSIECTVIEECPEVSLGGKTLKFISTPFLHWPDTISTWLPEDRLLFSCDVFASHVCDEGMYDDQVSDLETDFHIYYDALMRPFRDKVLEAVAKVEKLDAVMICPSHGPILRREPMRYVQQYKKWATLEMHAKPYLAVLYSSAHGKTRHMAEALAEGMKRRDVEVELLHISETPEEKLRAAMENADGLLFGCSTIVRDLPPPMWRVMALLSTVKLRARNAAAFGSYGWSGEAVAMIEQRLKDMRIPLLPSELRFKFTPTGEDLERCRKFGEGFAKAAVEG